MNILLKTTLFLSIFMTGCSSIINGSKQDMMVESTPSNARIQLLSSRNTIITESTGQLSYNLKRSDGYFSGASYKIKITAPGFADRVIPIESRISGWYIGGNILFGGFIGWLIVDPATGGMWVLETEDGQDIEGLKVTLLENASGDILSKATKIESAF